MKLFAAAALVVLVLTGCAADPLAQQYAEGTNQNYISGDGTLTLIEPADRGEPVTFEAETADGKTVSSEQFAGEVLVLNFWYAGCPPCRDEAPDLQELFEKFDGEGASFLGVNVRDQAQGALFWEKENGIGYPSVIDANEGTMLLAFAGTVAPNAVPTTLVVDAQGRVAARFLGKIDPSTLKTIITETIAEGS
jgi:peroxiredoxin